MFLAISLGVLAIGFILLGLAGWSYRWRAFTNKPAWDGKTKPLMFWGFLFFVVGLVLCYFAYSATYQTI